MIFSFQRIASDNLIRGHPLRTRLEFYSDPSNILEYCPCGKANVRGSGRRCACGEEMLDKATTCR